MTITRTFTFNLGTELEAEETIKLLCEWGGIIPSTPLTVQNQTFAREVALNLIKRAPDRQRIINKEAELSNTIIT